MGENGSAEGNRAGISSENVDKEVPEVHTLAQGK